MMTSRETRITAARLDRFKKADHWSQRRVEDGFASHAECFAENNRASRWNDKTGADILEDVRDAVRFARMESDYGPNEIPDIGRNWKIIGIDEEPFLFAPVGDIWQRFKAINWWYEIKDAFPFFWCKRINGIIHTPWEMANGILKIEMTIQLPGVVHSIPIKGSFSFDEDEQPCHDTPNQINLAPYYVAVLVLAALLILDGFLTHWGFVNYSPILK